MIKSVTVLLVLAIATSSAAPQSLLAEGDRANQSQEWGLARRKAHNQDVQKESDQQPNSDDDGIVLPNYEFSYGVFDPTTGDHKNHWEKRVEDHVRGAYMLDQPDGKKRVVEYEGDDKRGIEQIVKEIDRSDESNVRENRNEIAQSYSSLKQID